MKQNTKYTQLNTNKSTHSEMGPVWQNPIQRTKNCSSKCAYVRIQLLMRPHCTLHASL